MKPRTVADDVADFADLRRRVRRLEQSSAPAVAFSAAKSTSLTVNGGTSATVIFDTEEFDRNDWYDPSTGIFTPLAAGIYRLSCTLFWTSVSSGARQIILGRNGSGSKYMIESPDTGISGTILAEANGIDDGFSIITYNSGSTASLNAVPYLCYFQGEFVCP